MSYVPRLRSKYHDEIIGKLKEQFQYKSIMQVPKLQKICLNQGVGAATQDKKMVDNALNEMTMIAGQKAVSTKAKISVSNFKLREGMPIGTRVTLRQDRMYEFLDKLVNIALPRVRDFQGVSNKAFDGRGNFTLGVKEQLIFPEINYDKVNKVRGMDIVVVTTAKTDLEALELLTQLGMPFKK